MLRYCGCGDRFRRQVSALLVKTCVTLGLVIGLVSAVSARPRFVAQIPNGFTVGCGACHVDSGGGGRLNGFGHQIQKGFLIETASGHGVVWSRDLASRDADGDGFSNGQELQDRSGAWRQGNQFPGSPSLVSNPGDNRSVPPGGSTGPSTGALRGSCAIRNAAGRANIIVQVDNASTELLQSLTPGTWNIRPAGTASISLATGPRPLRELAPRRTARFLWRAAIAGAGSLDLSIEITARLPGGNRITTGTVSCNRVSVGNQGEANVRPTRTARPTRTPLAARPTRTRASTSTPRPTRTPLP